MTQRPSKPVNPRPRHDTATGRSAKPGRATAEADPAVAGSVSSGDPGTGSDKVDLAFDLWLKRGLHQIYDDVAREPIPEDLLRLIQEDKKK